MLMLTACSTRSAGLQTGNDGGDVRAGGDGVGNKPAIGDLGHETASGYGIEFGAGPDGAGEGLDGGEDTGSDGWSVVPFSDPRSGTTYDIIDGRVIIATKLYTPLPARDGNFYDTASASQLAQFYSECSYPSTILTNPQVQAFIAAEAVVPYSEWPEVGGFAVILPEGQSVLDAVANWPSQYPQLIDQVDPNEALGDCLPFPQGEPNDDLFGSQWHLSPDEAYDTKAQEAWASNYQTIQTATPFTVAILDTGVFYGPSALPDLWERSTPYGCNTYYKRSLTQFYLRPFGGSPPHLDRSPEDAKHSGHGTCCAGIIAAKTNNDGMLTYDDGLDIAGMSIAPKFFPVAMDYDGRIRKFSQDAMLNALTAIGCVAKRYNKSNLYGPNFFVPEYTLKVVNCSFSGGGDNAVGNRHLNELGPYMLFVCAAGNNNSGTERVWPAKHPLAMCVGAHDRNGRRSKWDPPYGSNYPDILDLSAPGTGVWTTDMPGTNFYGAPLGYSGDGILGGDFESIFAFPGTSAAAPVVSGAAIMVAAKHTSLTPAQVFQRLTNSGAHDYRDFDLSHLDEPAWYNKGRLNVKKAMDNVYP